MRSPRRWRRALILSLCATAAVVSAVCAFCFRRDILEAWHVHNLKHGGGGSQRRAIKALAECSGETGLAALIELGRSLSEAACSREDPPGALIYSERLVYSDWRAVVAVVVALGGEAGLRALSSGLDSCYVVALLEECQTLVRIHRGIMPFMLECLRTEDSWVRNTAMMCLIRSEGMDAKDFAALRSALATETDPVAQRAVLTDLVEFDIPASWTLPVFLEMLKDADWDRRWLGCRNIQYIVDRLGADELLKVRNALSELVSNASERMEVRRMALEALDALPELKVEGRP